MNPLSAFSNIDPAVTSGGTTTPITVDIGRLNSVAPGDDFQHVLGKLLTSLTGAQISQKIGQENEKQPFDLGDDVPDGVADALLVQVEGRDVSNSGADSNPQQILPVLSQSSLQTKAVDGTTTLVPATAQIRRDIPHDIENGIGESDGAEEILADNRLPKTQMLPERATQPGNFGAPGVKLPTQGILDTEVPWVSAPAHLIDAERRDEVHGAQARSVRVPYTPVTHRGEIQASQRLNENSIFQKVETQSRLIETGSLMGTTAKQSDSGAELTHLSKNDLGAIGAHYQSSGWFGSTNVSPPLSKTDTPSDETARIVQKIDVDQRLPLAPGANGELSVREVQNFIPSSPDNQALTVAVGAISHPQIEPKTDISKTAQPVSENQFWEQREPRIQARAVPFQADISRGFARSDSLTHIPETRPLDGDLTNRPMHAGNSDISIDKFLTDVETPKESGALSEDVISKERKVTRSGAVWFHQSPAQPSGTPSGAQFGQQSAMAIRPDCETSLGNPNSPLGEMKTDGKIWENTRLTEPNRSFQKTHVSTLASPSGPPVNTKPEQSESVVRSDAFGVASQPDHRPTAEMNGVARQVFETTLPRTEIAQQVAVQITHSISQSGERPIELLLNPAELGRVRIAVTANDGVVTVNILAERPETMELVRRHVDLLSQEFRNSGFGSASFTFDGRGEKHTAQNNGHFTQATEPPDRIETQANPPLQLKTNVVSDRIDIRL